MKGHYFEFGSFGARTFRLAWDHSRAYLNNAPHLINEIHLFAFDSFQGFPKSNLNEDKHKKFPEGLASMSQDDFINTLVDYGIDMEKVTITSGFYKDSLNDDLKNNLLNKGYKNNAGVVYFDCDLYSSTTEALEFISPFLQNGSVLCFDDYYCYEGSKEKGQQLAINHWLKSNQDFYLHPYENFGWHGKIFIFNRKF